MEIVFFIIAVAVFVLNISAKKKQEERKKAEAARRAADPEATRPAQQQPRQYTPPRPTVQPTVQPAYSPQQRQYAPPQARQTPPPQSRQTPPPQYSRPQQPQQQAYGRPRPAQANDPRFFDAPAGSPSRTVRARSEGQPSYSPIHATSDAQSAYAGVRATSDRHVVAPVTESAHGHMETSATGFVDCPPELDAHGVPIESPLPVHISGLSFDRSSLASAVLYSEILSKPRALRPR